MKLLLLSVLVVALSTAVLALPQSNGRKGSSAAAARPAAASAGDSIPILEDDKPFVPPCGLRQKLESNCNAGKTESTKEDCIDCVHTIFKIKCVEPVEKESAGGKLDCKSVTDCFESIVFQC